MSENLPQRIVNESDLTEYENYINRQELPTNTIESLTVPQHHNHSFLAYENKDVPQELSNTSFLPAFLCKQIGKLIRVELLVGNNLEMRYGILLTVGANYLVLRQFKSNVMLTCDIPSIKFITVVPDNDINKLFMK
ncbi:MAG: hypothetical protein IKI29_06405 [Clostridia bacterium]|nr:hypothetical protein [Clostridia bacterium]